MPNTQQKLEGNTQPPDLPINRNENEEDKPVESEDELVEFADKLRVIMDKADQTTKMTLHALSDLETSIDHANANMVEFFKEMKLRERRLKNIQATLSEFETALAIFDHLDHDRLRLCQGPTSMSLEEYIGKLEFIRTLENFAWFGNYKCSTGYLAKLGTMVKTCDIHIATE